MVTSQTKLLCITGMIRSCRVHWLGQVLIAGEWVTKEPGRGMCCADPPPWWPINPYINAEGYASPTLMLETRLRGRYYYVYSTGRRLRPGKAKRFTQDHTVPRKCRKHSNLGPSDSKLQPLLLTSRPLFTHSGGRWLTGVKIQIRFLWPFSPPI